MAKHPYLIGGKDRFDTDFNTAMNGRGITKVGGEAIRGMVIKTAKYGVVGIAQKILDGNQRVNEAAIMAILNHLNQMPDAWQLVFVNKDNKALVLDGAAFFAVSPKSWIIERRFSGLIRNP